MCLYGCTPAHDEQKPPPPEPRQSSRPPTITCPQSEERRIVVAQGLQFQNADMSSIFRIPDALIDRGLAIESGKQEWYYDSKMQGIRFRLRIITRKDEFKAAFETPGIHLIYDGHARYGRGPCFGREDSSYPLQSKDQSMGEQWEDGAEPPLDGIFRMGFLFNAVPVSEIVEHGYTPHLVSTDIQLKERRADCDPDLRPYLGVLRKLTKVPFAVKNAPKEFWGYRRDGEQYVVIRAGWKNTTTTPWDLGATTPKSRVFCHFGCSSFRHNQPVLRTLKAWKKSGDEHHAFFTTASSYSWTGPIWLYHLFTFPVFNACMPWEASLAYTVAKTNAELTVENRKRKVPNYQII